MIETGGKRSLIIERRSGGREKPEGLTSLDYRAPAGRQVKETDVSDGLRIHGVRSVPMFLGSGSATALSIEGQVYQEETRTTTCSTRQE